jgi:hypothetical protein
MRGVIKNFNSFIEKEKPTQDKQRPRNFYMPERNTLLVNRYYYYAQFKQYRYDVCLKKLELEFYLTEVRIVFVLSSCSVYLSEVMKSKPTIKELKNKFPHFNWDMP